MNFNQNLRRWYQERIRHLTKRIEDALLEGRHPDYIEELQDARTRFEELLDELPPSDDSTEDPETP